MLSSHKILIVIIVLIIILFISNRQSSKKEPYTPSGLCWTQANARIAGECMGGSIYNYSDNTCYFPPPPPPPPSYNWFVMANNTQAHIKHIPLQTYINENNIDPLFPNCVNPNI
jgi:hypothetical protein